MPRDTTALLERWATGDRDALDALLAEHLGWIRAQVRRSLGPRLRAKLQSDDVIQEAIIEFLRYGPQLRLSSGQQFRALMARIVSNTLRTSGSWFSASRRELSREVPIETTVVDLTAEASPSARAERNELEARLRLAMDLLHERDRQLLLWREWDRLTYPEIGRRLHIKEDAARKAHGRARTRLNQLVARIRRGEVEAAIEGLEQTDDDMA